MDSTSTYAGLVAVGLVIVSMMVLGGFFRRHARGPVYRRTKTYKTQDKHREFIVLGNANLEDLEDFITFLLHRFSVRIFEEDRELDDMVWIIGSAADWIEVHYDDHEGTRLRGPKKSRGTLFNRMEKDFKTRR